MRVADLERRPGLKLESRNDRLSLDAPLFRGEFWHREMRRGLHVHASNVFEVEDFTAISSQQAGLSCIFLIDGDVAIEVGERRFDFHGTGKVREGVMIPSARVEEFRRISRGHQKLRHLVISVTHEWLDRDGMETMSDRRLASEIADDHLAGHSWTATPRLAELVQRILAPAGAPSDLRDLLIESAAVEIIAEALGASTHQEERDPATPLTAYDRNRLRRAEDYIAGHSGALLVADIAREAGTSGSGLQRLFKAVHGTSVVEHIRLRRLEQARKALAEDRLSVQEASTLAGYGNAANFATAFKRQFGLSPSEVRRLPSALT
jgi:AraC-like DNA-binding protein